MKIARNMNLIAEVETENGQCWVHSTPISKEVYRQHFFILSKVFASIFSEGLGVVAGPRVAYLLLEKIAGDMNIWEGESGVRNTLVNEIIRLSNFVYPVKGKGWDNQPLEVAIDKGIVDLDEVIGELVFFTCVSAINKPDQAKTLMVSVAGLWNSQITSLNVTDWTASLPTLKPGGNTGGTESTSSANSLDTLPA
ncbi:hypothetical protein IFU23_05650 [Pantoea agglomerans]|uniref:Uncharacterized protein n=1 Tax=Enterobacter agglomerans TaxID=549 RepID=A0ACC5PX18_ENTAG|nr:hypothetical protein [Pantoea agglomerans]MBD8128935.1 hypothetical protein [Pantoea agglomerans]MBD8152233.1 hypothetical protein [Pantoea agglomerans]MBD8157590.1 hypothetical protein [Pantoea agglomerans]MBD8231411.1 hypothetical protein [Pantoea agglomerans]MBD8241878.1 hypothetical protein [Pantoea agglomerans]